MRHITFQGASLTNLWGNNILPMRHLGNSSARQRSPDRLSPPAPADQADEGEEERG